MKRPMKKGEFRIRKEEQEDNKSKKKQHTFTDPSQKETRERRQ